MNWMKSASAGVLSIVLAVAAAGCDRSAPPAPTPAVPATPATNAPAAKGAVETAIEAATGKIAVEQGRAAEEKIRKISDQRNKDLDEVTQ